MRIIIKQCRAGTSLSQSAQQQKQAGQRQRVRKAASLNALLDLISFGHFPHQAKPSITVSIHRHATLVSHCYISGLSLTHFLDFTVDLKIFLSSRTAKIKGFCKFIIRAYQKDQCAVHFRISFILVSI